MNYCGWVFHSSMVTRLQIRCQDQIRPVLDEHKTALETLMLTYDEQIHTQNQYLEDYDDLYENRYICSSDDYITDQQHIDRCNEAQRQWKWVTKYIEELELCNCRIKLDMLDGRFETVLDNEKHNLDVTKSWASRIDYVMDRIEDDLEEEFYINLNEDFSDEEYI